MFTLYMRGKIVLIGLSAYRFVHVLNIIVGHTWLRG